MKKFLNKGLLKAFVRGFLKGFPAINAVIEGAENVKAKALANKGEAVDPKPHSWASLIIQLVVTISLTYLVVSGKLTAKDLETIWRTAREIFSVVSENTPPDVNIGTDTLNSIVTITN